MSSAQPHYSKKEFSRRGELIFEHEILPQLQGIPAAYFVAIDIETGDFEVDADELAASDRLLARRTDAQIWLRRVGSRFARRFGSFRRSAAL